MRLATVFALLLALATPALAQGDCALGTASAHLTYGDTIARLFNKGNIVYDGSVLYEVPKGSGISPLFAGGLWVGGLVNGELRTAAATYAQGEEDYEFWPGPLDANGNPPADCAPYDRIWKVSVDDVRRFETTGAATPDLAAWPVDLGAPVTDGDGNPDNYDLEGGDRPLLFGHETAFWVMNDAGGFHATTLTPPIGLEVRVTAFAIAAPEAALDQATYFRYELEYNGDAPLTDAYFTLWTDTDLGNFSDDYIATDTTRSLAYTYNADNDDEASAGGYGLNPPAFGVDFLDGAGHTMYFNGSGIRTGDPNTDEEYYNIMQAQWLDGSSLTEGGDGSDLEGIPIDFMYPGDPVVPAFWSEVCPTPACDVSIQPDDRRYVTSTPSFTLEPGETKTVDFALLFARGADHLDSVTELRAASDFVQARYDAGTLFAPFTPRTPIPSPELLAPTEGALFVEAVPTLTWAPVAGAVGYTVEVDSPAGEFVAFTTETSLQPAIPTGGINDVIPVTWHVRAESATNRIGVSDYRTFDYYRYAFDFFGRGVGVVETESPAGEVCPAGTDDPGCADYGGNTVWLDPNAAGDYALATESSFASGPDIRDVADADIIGDDDFEMRFTPACAPFGACLGAYIRDGQTVVSVPFELWNIRDPEDDSDDVRMIPLIRDNGEAPLTDWADAFTGSQPLEDGGEAVPVTEPVYWMMPDRPNGYDLFEIAANAFGGPGAVYDPEADGDTQIDLNSAGTECARQGWYVDFCYRDVPPYRAPIGSGDGLLVADVAGDGTTPPAGTTVRFDSTDRLLEVGAEEEGPAAPAAFALEAPYPNPFGPAMGSAATVGYRLGAPVDIRLVVYDVLGRKVAVLADGPKTTGAHRAEFDGAGLASGVYLVVLEAEGRRQARKVLLVR